MLNREKIFKGVLAEIASVAVFITFIFSTLSIIMR